MLGDKYDFFIIKSSNDAKHCIAFDCRENYAVFQERRKSGIDGKMRCQMTEKPC